MFDLANEEPRLAPDICVNNEMDLPAVEDPATEEVLGC